MHLKGNELSSDLTFVFHSIPCLYLLLAPDFTIELSTDLYATTASVRADEVIGVHVAEAFLGGSDSVAKQALLASLTSVVLHKQPHTMPPVQHGVFFNTGGSNAAEKFWQITHTPIFNSEGELIHILHALQDVTDAVLQEQPTGQSQEALALFNSSLGCVAWEYDIQNDQLIWGDGLKEVFGYAPEEMGPNGDSWDKRVHPDDFAALQQSITDAMAAGHKIWTGEYRFRKANGTYAHVLDQGYVVYNAKGKPVRTFGSIIDLANSKKAEEDLKESDERFRHLLENLPHMAWTADAKGKVLYFNDNWYSFTGMAKGQTDGWTSVIHPEDTADVLTNWHEALQSGNLYEMEYRIKDAMNNDYRTFMVRGVPMHDHDGQVRTWVGTYTDIEDQKQSLDRARLKDQQLETILHLSPAHFCLLTGPDYTCTYVSPGIYRMFGNRPYIGSSALQIWAPDEPFGHKQTLDQVYVKEEVVQLDEVLITGSPLHHLPTNTYYNLKYQPVFSNEGAVEGILISAIEVTELVGAKALT